MAKCLICGWPIEEYSESQVRTCQHRHEELKKRRREETLRRTRKLVTGDTPRHEAGEAVGQDVPDANHDLL